MLNAHLMGLVEFKTIHLDDYIKFFGIVSDKINLRFAIVRNASVYFQINYQTTKQFLNLKFIFNSSLDIKFFPKCAVFFINYQIFFKLI